MTLDERIWDPSTSLQLQFAGFLALFNARFASHHSPPFFRGAHCYSIWTGLPISALHLLATHCYGNLIQVCRPTLLHKSHFYRAIAHHIEPLLLPQYPCTKLLPSYLAILTSLRRYRATAHRQYFSSRLRTTKHCRNSLAHSNKIFNNCCRYSAHH